MALKRIIKQKEIEDSNGDILYLDIWKDEGSYPDIRIEIVYPFEKNSWWKKGIEFKPIWIETFSYHYPSNAITYNTVKEDLIAGIEITLKRYEAYRESERIKQEKENLLKDSVLKWDGKFLKEE